LVWNIGGTQAPPILKAHKGKTKKIFVLSYPAFLIISALQVLPFCGAWRFVTASRGSSFKAYIFKELFKGSVCFVGLSYGANIRGYDCKGFNAHLRGFLCGAVIRWDNQKQNKSKNFLLQRYE